MSLFHSDAQKDVQGFLNPYLPLSMAYISTFNFFLTRLIPSFFSIKKFVTMRFIIGASISGLRMDLTHKH
jgi:hypothetical protein